MCRLAVSNAQNTQPTMAEMLIVLYAEVRKNGKPICMGHNRQESMKHQYKIVSNYTGRLFSEPSNPYSNTFQYEYAQEVVNKYNLHDTHIVVRCK